MRKNWLINRRTCLKGLGAALALPLLDAMGWAETSKSAPYKPPVRLAWMYMPHGVIEKNFWPTDPATFLTEPPRSLLSLKPVLDQCLVMKGIEGIAIAPFNGAPHALELSTWLTATLPNANKRDTIDIAISADQIAANYVGAFTPLPSLELATMPQTHKENQEGLNEGYYSHCSFSSPTQPLPAEINPTNVFNRLFSARPKNGDAIAGGAIGEEGSLDRNMLDLVLGGAKDLRKNLGRGDQVKLDEYLDGVRSLERRVAAIEYQRAQAAKEASGEKTNARRATSSPPIEVTLPEGKVKFSEYMQVMGDLTILAFQSDITRISTCIGSTPNGLSYPELGFSDQHHSLTHHNFDEEKVEKITKINEFLIAQWAYMIKKMAVLKEGDGTLLDHSIMMWGSGLEDGNKHGRNNLPFVIAGKGGGSIKPGRFLPNTKGSQGDLLGTLLTCAGIPLDKPIGNGTKILKEMMA